VIIDFVVALLHLKSLEPFGEDHDENSNNRGRVGRYYFAAGIGGRIGFFGLCGAERTSGDAIV
jgi:hypothetical protein